jgi:H+/Cl- antiporter ClcA
MVAMFCGVLNCPIASIILSIELFGSQGIILFAVTSAISYMLSGYYGLYGSQKIMYSKLKAEYINQKTK